ncbi:ferric reductase-like transmembrane domain-containing protein [Paenibacillus sp. AR247]|uniref:ferric reductase-like transmembrane domain-containing protein n=1 Tax=Paenibacillus sp. AR247 TaxID=1631599 RepID=UPI000CF86842|nr:ferric reductase-like transmembrane domain-containing protein [Paenibacillus sp. AR247]PQP89791.1 ferric reductase [Paenibacillus sp. AR247]
MAVFHHFGSSISQILSVWVTTRAAGLTSYMLLFASVAAGLLQGGAWAKGPVKAKLNMVHQWCGWFGLLFGMVHGLVLLFDRYVGYSLADLLIPFKASGDRLWMGLGILSLYLMMLLIISSDLMKKLGKKAWRLIHFLAMPTYLMALVHGIMLGTDSRQAPVLVLYAVTGVTVLILLVNRIAASRRKGGGRMIVVQEGGKTRIKQIPSSRL